jgi:hypothetical protein
LEALLIFENCVALDSTQNKKGALISEHPQVLTKGSILKLAV